MFSVFFPDHQKGRLLSISLSISLSSFCRQRGRVQVSQPRDMADFMDNPMGMVEENPEEVLRELGWLSADAPTMYVWGPVPPG